MTALTRAVHRGLNLSKKNVSGVYDSSDPDGQSQLPQLPHIGGTTRAPAF